MTEKSVFISSCSRRQLARRRSGRSARRPVPAAPRAAWRYTLPSALVTAAAGFAAYLVARGGL